MLHIGHLTIKCQLAGKKTKWHINIHNEKIRKGENKNRGGEGLKFVHIGSQLPIPQLPW